MNKEHIAVVMTELVDHAKHGERDGSIPDDVYELRLRAVQELRTAFIDAGPEVDMSADPEAAVKAGVDIVLGELEGVYDAAD